MSQQLVTEHDPWELESGIPNDVDAYMRNCRFGVSEEYAKVVVANAGSSRGAQFMFDMVSPDGDVLGTQGYSIGKGWEISEDGLTIKHASFKNVVRSTRYGTLQQVVTFKTDVILTPSESVPGLGVNMNQYGKPTDARTWEGLGFHWMVHQLDQLSGTKKSNTPLPSKFLGKLEPGQMKPVGAGATSQRETTAVTPELKTKLDGMAKSMEKTKFMIESMKMEEVSRNDKLVANVTDDGPSGYWETARKQPAAA